MTYLKREGLEENVPVVEGNAGVNIPKEEAPGRNCRAAGTPKSLSSLRMKDGDNRRLSKSIIIHKTKPVKSILIWLPPPISSPRQIAHLNRTSEMILRLSSDLGQKPFGGIGKLDDTPACTGHTSKSWRSLDAALDPKRLPTFSVLSSTMCLLNLQYVLWRSAYDPPVYNNRLGLFSG